MSGPDHATADSRGKALEKAGIPVARHAVVLDEIAQMFEVHTLSNGAEPNGAALKKFITAAKKARDLFKALPAAVRLSIDTPKSANGEWALDLPTSFAITGAEAELDTLIKKSEAVHNGGRGKSGRKVDSRETLLFSMLLLWEREMKGCRGIAKNGAEDSYPNSPLVDLVERLLRLERLSFGSRGAVGRRLYNMVQFREKLEKRAAEKPNAPGDNPAPN